MSLAKSYRRSGRGFSLIELVVAIVIGAIVMAIAATMITAPVDGYFAQSRRADLVDTSDRIARMLVADVRTSLPNSVRVGVFATTRTLQMLQTTDVVFYQDQAVTPGLPAQTLDLTLADAQFYAFGQFQAPLIGRYLVVNHTGLVGGTAYALANVIVSGNTATMGAPAGNATPVTLTPGFHFTNGGSPTHRMFEVSGPITYVCDLGAQTITRFSSHAIGNNIPVNAGDAQLNSAGTVMEVVATGVTGCALTCSAVPAATPCGDSVKMEIDFVRMSGSNSESMKLVQQLALETRS
jgi:MSHA biogenesis protein MshO